MKITRSDRSDIALWWWTIDRYLLTGFFTLIIFGIFLVMASSQHLAESLNIPSHHFTIRHLLFGSISIPIIIFFSASKVEFLFGNTVKQPPDNPFPK